MLSEKLVQMKAPTAGCVNQWEGTVVLEKTPESPLEDSPRRSNQFILKEINPEYSLEKLIRKLQYVGHLI